jgi:photosystem II stability/assembly factor-like uncharacterized protein
LIALTADRIRRFFDCAAAGLLLVAAPASPALDTPLADGSIHAAVTSPRASVSLLTGAARAGARIVAVGERGHLLLIDGPGDDGFRQVPVPVDRLLTAVSFVDAERGLAVGHDALILRTGDGGETWEPVHAAPLEDRPLLSVVWLDRERAVAVGAYGLALASEDGGRSWRAVEVDPGEDFHLNAVAVSADGRVYIAGESGRVYRSDDGGESWHVLPFPYHGSLFGVRPLHASVVLAFGLRGHLFRSEDAGMHWRRIDTATAATLTAAATMPGGGVVLVGHEGAVLVSFDGGRTVSALQAPRSRRSFSDLVVDGRALWLFGEGGARRLDLPVAPAR